MENRLIPPSHFDSEENLANEEPWHGDTTPRVAGIQFLRPPEHFSSIAAGGNSNGLLNIGRNTARRCNPGIYPGMLTRKLSECALVSLVRVSLHVAGISSFFHVEQRSSVNLSAGAL